jgi:hypothetical protein
MSSIMAATEHIVRKNERGDTTLSALDRVSEVSERVWTVVQSLPLSSISSLEACLTNYELILIDVRHNVTSRDLSAIHEAAVNRRLDDFLQDFQAAIDRLRTKINEAHFPESANFFQNSHDFVISGGSFTINSVVHDGADRRSRRLLQLQYLQLAVLFC